MIRLPIEPLLLYKTDEIPKTGYLAQLKFDGDRCLLSFDRENGTKLYTRHKNPCHLQYPEVAGIPWDLDDVTIDGEMVCFQSGKPCFDSLRERFSMTKSLKIKQASKFNPVHFVAFDLLSVNGISYVNEPIEKRLEKLKQILPSSEYISLCPTFLDGELLYRFAVEHDLEGIVLKKNGSKYPLTGKRYKDLWLKKKNYMFESVTIQKISKKKFGWTLLRDNKYVGLMEFVPPEARKQLRMIQSTFTEAEDKDWYYLKPQIKCRVKFQCYSRNGMMRSPSFVEFIK